MCHIYPIVSENQGGACSRPSGTTGENQQGACSVLLLREAEIQWSEPCPTSQRSSPTVPHSCSCGTAISAQSPIPSSKHMSLDDLHLSKDFMEQNPVHPMCPDLFFFFFMISKVPQIKKKHVCLKVKPGSFASLFGLSPNYGAVLPLVISRGDRSRVSF